MAEKKEANEKAKKVREEEVGYEETKEAIPMIRDFLQGEINDAHGDEWVVIHWSKFENINKPDFELR